MSKAVRALLAKAGLIASLFLAPALSSTPSSLSIADIDQAASERQLAKLKRSIKALDGWLDKANSEKSGLAKQLRTSEKQIARLSRDIRQLSNKDKTLRQRLGELKRQQKQQTRAINSQKGALVAQLKTLYLEGQQPAIKRLLDSDNPQELARYLRYFDYLKDARNDKMAAFSAALSKLEATEQRILEQQSKLARNKSALQSKKLAVNKEAAQRKQLLRKLERNIASKSQELQKLKNDQNRLEGLLKELEQAIANIPLPSDSTPFRLQRGKLMWPLRGRIKQRFGSRIAQGKLKSRGIHIASQSNRPVKSVHYGQVVFSDWIRGFGLLLIIDHGDGYMSLYGNNNSLEKAPGEWVSAGETIAYSGNSGGLSSNGLYFEIRRHGKPINPVKWLKK